MCKELVINNTVIRTSLYQILQDVQSLLNNGKLKDIREKGSEILVTCPFHKDGKEERPSCFIYCGDSQQKLSWGTFHCFTCGEKGPFWHFVAACFDKSDDWAKKWLITNYGEERLNAPIQLEPITLPRTKSSLYKMSLFNQSSYNKKYDFNNYQSWHPYMSKRKLARSICEQFQVKYDPITKCIIFPVWDDRNNLVMVTKRSTLTKKFYIEESKQKPVYLLNYIKTNNIKTVYVCESQINCLYLWSLGYPAIALFGTGSSYQYQLLNKSGIEHYYLCFDGDQAGDNGIKRFINNIKKDVFVDVIKVPRGKDMNDLSKDEILNLQKFDKYDFLKNYQNNTCNN